MSSRTKVLNGNANSTSGGLTASDLTRNNKGRIVSRAKSEQAKSSPALAAWREVTSEYTGSGKMVPKKGTAAYNKLYKRYQELLGR
jgi:hypothetical protein